MPDLQHGDPHTSEDAIDDGERHGHGTADPTADLPTGSRALARDCRGEDFFALDASLRTLIGVYMPEPLARHMWPHFQRLGQLAGGRLDELAAIADRHPPVLHHRDRFGHDEDWIEYHPAYGEMARIAWKEFGLHAMSHRGGVLGWPEPVPPVAKYVFQYLFVQGEFGIMCPISVSDTSAFLLARYGSEELKSRYLERMLSQDMDTLLTGTQFMTEKAAGSDVGRIETVAVPDADGEFYRLYGEKWFCSHTDADVAMLLARPEDAAAQGTAALGLFLMPRVLEDGRRNGYRIARLKDKLGTRSMASGEIRLEGAVAYPVGDPGRGLKQMLDQVNLSRLSHGVRAAAMMRRCLNEALRAARTRMLFGGPAIDRPLMQRQLMKIMLPTEQALSVFMYSALTMGEAAGGDEQAARVLRILTPLLKLRACRDNIRVATGAMEVRGGNGYIEDWVEARLVRDAHVGLLWEGTSNINALDVVTRAVARHDAHHALAAGLDAVLEAADGIPAALRNDLSRRLQRAVALAGYAASDGDALARQAARTLYDATSAVLLASEGAVLGARGKDARRLLLSRLVISHCLSARDPLSPTQGPDEAELHRRLLSDEPVEVEDARSLARTE
jgi:alkylation response protein AidB-like acyl-CoA dehydrogenase